ncbi:Terminase small subunit [compost metagenome]
MELTAKQKRFIEEYLIDLNATRAYKAAGYSVKSDNAAAVEGHKLLRNPKIASEVQKSMDDRSERTKITADKVLQEFAKIGFAKITDYLKVNTAERVVDYKEDEDEEGNITRRPIFDMVQSVEIFDTDEVDSIKMDAVAEITETKYGISLKLHDKVSALEKIGRHLGMFKDKIEHSGGVSHTHSHDLRNLSPEELMALERILAKSTADTR